MSTADRQWSKSSARRRGLLRQRRGSVLIETLVVVPLFTAIWAGAVRGFAANTQVIDGRRSLRACAWAYVMSGCEQLAGGCADGGGGAVLEPPAALTTALTTLAGSLPFLADFLGEAFPGPAAALTLAGAPPGVGGFVSLCNPVPPPLTVETVFTETCALLGGFCP